MPQKQTARYLTIRGATGKLRTATFRTQEHIVVPTVMLVEGVIFAMNAEAPELVRLETLVRGFQSWNGRPLVGGHPVDNTGKPVLANDPAVLEKEQFGFVANAVVDRAGLAAEGWINPTLVRTGTIAENVLRRLQDGKTIEVSVGAFVVTEEVEGEWRGKKYFAEWKEIYPDHLAFLDEGDTGACSVDMGCGALRDSRVHLVTAQGFQLLPTEEEMKKCKKCGKDYEGDACTNSACVTAAAAPPPPLSLRQRVIFETAASEDLTSNELYSALDSALRGVEPGYEGIVDILLNQNQVVYVRMVDDAWKLYERGYSTAEDGIKLAKDVTEVKIVSRYEPVAARAAAAPRAACGCQTQTQGATDMNRDERIAALIAKGAYKDEDKTWLKTIPDGAFETLAKSYEAPAQTPPAPAAAVETPPAPAAAPVTAEQFLASAPENIREVLTEGLAAAATRRTALIAGIKASGRNKFSDDQLNAKSTAELEMIAELAQVPSQKPTVLSFSGRGIPPAEPQPADNSIPEPPDLITAIQNKGKAS